MSFNFAASSQGGQTTRKVKVNNSSTANPNNYIPFNKKTFVDENNQPIVNGFKFNNVQTKKTVKVDLFNDNLEHYCKNCNQEIIHVCPDNIGETDV